MDTTVLKQQYQRDGFVSGIDILNTDQALEHRQKLEAIESRVGPMHYKSKIHTLFRSPYEIATQPLVLDIIKALIGPDILLYNVTYIIKEAKSQSHVSWHQDLTYWGFNDDAQVSMWLALSPTNESSGCMKMIPGSHNQGIRKHVSTSDETNVLLSGQTVRDVDTDQAVLCELQPGQASFHHGWTLHASMPNNSEDRRIGLNVQYLAPHMKQTKQSEDSALLVCGEDKYNHFEVDIPAPYDLAPEAVERQAQLEARYIEIAGSK